MAFRLQPPFCRFPSTAPTHFTKPIRIPKFLIRNLSFDDNHSCKVLLFVYISCTTNRGLVEPDSLCCSQIPQLVMEVKEKLEKDHFSLPVGRNGRDDEGMILWFLKDRKFSVEEAVSKLTKAIKWRQEFGVAELSEDSLKSIAATGKAYIHDHLDVSGRPVLIVDASKHLPGTQDPSEDERLCVFLVEKALSKLPDGKEEILGIFDLRNFGTKNADLRFLTFLFDVFYYYYPKRLGQVLFVDAPFVFKPIWQLAKPLLKQYASLVRFCSAETVRKEYFTEMTVPSNFSH